MKNSTFFKLNRFWLLLLPLFFAACESKMDEHYQKPEWLKGSAWDVLQSEGNFSHFQQAIELAGFRPYVEGKGILTVMAPDDEAFGAWLAAKGYASVEAVPAAELKKLVGFHLLYYSYNKSELENFRPEGQQSAADDGRVKLGAGLFYKFRTRSANAATKAIDPDNGKEITVYHQERFIPVFSHNFFTSKKIDAKRNYEYFYPNSTWSGDQGFNVSEASVVQYEVPANNGYVYLIDRVLEPLETIHEELKSNPAYSEFLRFYDYYSAYIYDSATSADYGPGLGVDSLYLHWHSNSLPPIAAEWPVSSYLLLDTLAYKSYSVFAPSNTALQTFYNSFWKGKGYPSLDGVDPLIFSILLNECVYGGSVVFPDEIVNGQISSESGTPYNFDPYSVTDRRMCVNGSFYGMDQLAEPLLFGSVAGPAFSDSTFRYFLYALDGSGMLNSYGSKTQKYTLLVPQNTAFTGSGYSLAEYASYNELQEQGEGDEGMVSVSATTLRGIVNVHTAMGETELKMTGTQVVPITLPYNYWYIKNGKITSSNDFLSVLEPTNTGTPFRPFTEVTRSGGAWNNGRAYTYDPDVLFTFDTGENATLQCTLAESNDRRYPYYAFGQLLKKAEMVSGNLILYRPYGRMIVFIPTNEAIYKALEENRIPGCTNASFDEEAGLTGTFDVFELRRYLQNYLVSAAAIPTCPYPGSEMKSGSYATAAGRTINYTDNGTSLSVRLTGGAECAVIPDYDYFPFAYSDGCFHLIDSLF